MAIIYKIHPAIGIARVGNSPDEFFIGPERVGEYPDPPSGFKDAQCRVKRQAARFRIFAHNDADGSYEEIDDSKAEITWTVHLVNSKAANPLRGNDPAKDPILTIDPGARTLVGPNQTQSFDTGKIQFFGSAAVIVPLGEIRSDDANHLLVLGGRGQSASPPGTSIGHFWKNTGWYDDVSDGSVNATIKLRSDGSAPPVLGAWVIVTPPKFAPQMDNIISLYDRIFQAMVSGGLVTEPSATSYTKDIYPILQRARDTQWVEDVPAVYHAWTDPVTSDAARIHIWNWLKVVGAPGTPPASPATMPELEDNTSDGRLTQVQYSHMTRWKDGAYTNDWVGVPPPQADITPDGLDRAALEACVGGAFYPGIEAGGRSDSERPIIKAGNYLEAFRLNIAVVKPGDISNTMALPWQADFKACGDNWWPVPRPNFVFSQGSFTQESWDPGVDMVTQWHQLGFIVKQGGKQVQVDRCDVASINLLTPHLNFKDVPQGPGGIVRKHWLAITFEVIAPGGAVTLKYAPGKAPAHPQLAPINNSDTVGPTNAANPVATARFWVEFSTGALGAIPQQLVVVTHDASGQTWEITIDGNTVKRKTTATALVLDRSGSMSEDRGDGQSKHDSLQQAANMFIDLMLQDDGVGVVRYNHDAQVLQPIGKLGDGGVGDNVRNDAKNHINGSELDPLGATSIGDGILEGRGILNTAPDPYDLKSLVVLTDGMENTQRYIADVAAEINELTYAVGFGKPENISVPALQTISGNNGGYLLVTGSIGTDQQFLLQKYFLQILAGIKNADVILDPDGELLPGTVLRIPFQLSDVDTGVEVILLSPYLKIIDFRLQTPNGLIIEPWRALAEPTMHYATADGLSYYRLALPTELLANRYDHGGTWHALLRIGHPRVERTDDEEQGIDRTILYRPDTEKATSQHALLQEIAGKRLAATPSRHGLPYSLVVHGYSDLSLRVTVQQTGYDPGSHIHLYASLGIALYKNADVWAEIRHPDGNLATLVLEQSAQGSFSGKYQTTMPGVYQLRVRATGQTLKGLRFTREHTSTVAVWLAGDRPGHAEPGSGNGLGASDNGQGGKCACCCAWLRRLFCKLRSVRCPAHPCQPSAKGK